MKYQITLALVIAFGLASPLAIAEFVRPDISSDQEDLLFSKVSATSNLRSQTYMDNMNSSLIHAPETSSTVTTIDGVDVNTTVASIDGVEVTNTVSSVDGLPLSTTVVSLDGVPVSTTVVSISDDPMSSAEVHPEEASSERAGIGTARDSNPVDSFRAGNFPIFIPSNASYAAGPFSVISAINSRIQSMSKDGQSNWEVLLSDFFVKYQPTSLFDPKVIYDVHSNVFAVLVLEASGECDAKISNILLAVSNNNNPMNVGDWSLKKINSLDIDQNRWADNSGLECDEDAYYIKANMYVCGTNFLQPKLWIVKKTDFENDQPQGFYLENIGTTQPAEVSEILGTGQDIGTYLIGENKDENLSSFTPLNPHLFSEPAFTDNTSETPETIAMSSTQHAMETLPLASPELKNVIRFKSLSYKDRKKLAVDIPPDPHGAAGPLSVIAVVNTMIQSTSKDGSLIYWELSLWDFFPSQNSKDYLFDPKIVFDKHTQRFALVTLFGTVDDCSKKGISNILLAISKSSNPSKNKDSWIFKKIPSLVNNNWADYPGFEYDEEAYYITANMRDCEKFVRSKIWIVNKSNLLVRSFGLPQWGLTGDNVMPAEVRPALGAGKNIGTYLVATAYSDNGSSEDGSTPIGITITRIRNPLGKIFVSTKQLVVDLGGTPKNAPQKGSDKRIEAGDSAILDAVWHDNSVWFVTTRLINDKTTAVWGQVDVSNWNKLNLKQSGIIDGDRISKGAYTFLPSIAVSKDGIVGIGFSASGPDLFVGAFFTWRRPTDPPRETRRIEAIQRGIAPYEIFDGKRIRWGDYNGMSLNPILEDCFWAYNEYASKDCTDSPETGCWTTAWARFCPVALTAVPSSKPSKQPSSKPSKQPSSKPSKQPSSKPSKQPSSKPSKQPSSKPSKQPSSKPSKQPSSKPSKQPSSKPSRQPSSKPSKQPSSKPSKQPSSKPSLKPSAQPSKSKAKSKSKKIAKQKMKKLKKFLAPKTAFPGKPIGSPAQKTLGKGTMLASVNAYYDGPTSEAANTYYYYNRGETPSPSTSTVDAYYYNYYQATSGTTPVE